MRGATAKFQRVEIAEAAGHQRSWKEGKIYDCVSNVDDPAAGAMGYY